jgi:hypothetical protein
MLNSAQPPSIGNTLNIAEPPVLRVVQRADLFGKRTPNMRNPLPRPAHRTSSPLPSRLQTSARRHARSAPVMWGLPAGCQVGPMNDEW